MRRARVSRHWVVLTTAEVILSEDAVSNNMLNIAAGDEGPTSRLWSAYSRLLRHLLFQSFMGRDHEMEIGISMCWASA